MSDSIYPQMKILQSKNFILRPITLEDAEDVFEYLSHEMVVKFLPIKSHKTVKDSKHFISLYFINSYKAEKISHYAVVYKKNNKVIGNAGFNNMKINSDTGDLGICINPKYWGNNFSQELLSLILKYAFEDLKLKEITATVYADNKYSLKPLETYNFIFSKTIHIKDQKNNKNKIQCNVYSLSSQNYFTQIKRSKKQKVIRK